jgi:DNA-binding winged helix-turn-helix (wHTH) protein
MLLMVRDRKYRAGGGTPVPRSGVDAEDGRDYSMSVFNNTTGRLEGSTTEALPLGSRHILSFGPFRLRVGERLLDKSGVRVPVGARALDILTVLASRAGEVVEKRELLASVWPAVIVDEGSLRFHMNGLRKALGDGKDGARYISTVPGRGYCFVAPIVRLEGPGLSIGQPGRADARVNLPSRLSRMIGREQTVHEVAECLLAKKFVTLLGPGGIGKTTMAISIGHQLLPAFDGSVRFVDLGAISDPHLVPSTVASAIGFVAHTADLVPSIVAFLQDKSLLIILDSCEHLIDSVAHLAERIHAGAPDVHLLATSREALRVEGERVFNLDPLSTPPTESDLDSRAALAFPAVQLFVERVTASGVRFELTDEDAPIVAEICRNLDGIPLAIELAAGRVSAYGVGGIATVDRRPFRPAS